MCISIATVYVFVNLYVVLYVCSMSHCRRCAGVCGGSPVCGCVRVALPGLVGGGVQENPHDGSKLSRGLFLAGYVWVRRTGRRRLRLLR